MTTDAQRSPRLLTSSCAQSRTSTSAPVSPTGDGYVEMISPKPSAGKPSNEILLAWPPKILNPNTRAHWAAKNNAVKRYRDDCHWLTKAAGLRVDWDGFVHAWITFYPPDRRHRDDDNLIAAFKSGRDGMAKALGIDDKRLRIHPWLSDEVVKGGAVRVRLSKGPL